MDLIDIVDGVLIIKPEILVISPFKELWEIDKSKDKKTATNQIKFIWFFYNFKSPYREYSEETREKSIISDIIRDQAFKVDKALKSAMEKYKELNYTGAMRMLDAADALILKYENYFKNVDLETTDVKKVSDVFSNMPKFVAAIKQARRDVQTEQENGVKIRGGASLGLFEDK